MATTTKSAKDKAKKEATVAEVKEEAIAEPAETEAKAEPKKEERVGIMLPLIEGEDRQVSVTINGEITIIPRGRMVKVKKSVAKLLENNSMQVMTAWGNEEKFKNQRTDL